MREKLEFPQHDPLEQPPQVDSDLIAPAGRTALAMEQVVFSHDYDVENHTQNVDFLDKYNNHSRWRTQVPRKTQVEAWITGAVSSVGHPVIAERVARTKLSTAETDRLDDIDNLRHNLWNIRRSIKTLDSYEQDTLGEGIESTLDEYATRHSLNPNELAFRQWKRKAEDEAGQPMTWAEWITRSSSQSVDPATLTQEDRQVLNLLHFNQTVFEERNNDPAQQERIQKLQDSYKQGLEMAIQAGLLSPKLLAAFNAKPSKAIIGEPLDEALLSANGYIDPKHDIVVKPDFKDGTYIHERTHQLGGLGDDFWNEGATQLMADTIDLGRGAPPHETPTYAHNVIAAHKVMFIGGVTIKEFSDYFAAGDGQGFFEKVTKTCGVDILGDYLKIRDSVEQHYSDPEDRKYHIQVETNKYLDDLKDKQQQQKQP